MIQTLNTTEYKNITIFTMHDTGAIFYEIDINNTPLYFNSLEEAKTHIDNL